MINKKNVTIIVPPVVTHNLDPHTGIPFLPHMAGYLAAKINHLGHNLDVIDCFGIDSKKITKHGEFTILGINEEDTVKKIKDDTEICFIYCKIIEDLFAVELFTGQD